MALDPLAAGDHVIAQAEKVQGMFGGGPIALVAAFFAIAFFGLLTWHLWRGWMDRMSERELGAEHRAELKALNEQLTSESVKTYAALNLLAVVQRDLAALADEARRKTAAADVRRGRPARAEESGPRRLESKPLGAPAEPDAKGG